MTPSPGMQGDKDRGCGSYSFRGRMVSYWLRQLEATIGTTECPLTRAARSVQWIQGLVGSAVVFSCPVVRHQGRPQWWPELGL